jgi:hypothetical protein
MKLIVRLAIALFALGTLLACAISSPLAPAPTSTPVATAPAATAPAATSAPASSVPAATPSSASTATAAVGASTGGQVPSSCGAIASIVGGYMGGVATTKSLVGAPQHLSCEFANAKATTLIVVNIGAGGTAAAFDTLRTISAKGGRTVTPINGLGVSAFSVSKGGVPAGVAVLTAQGFIYDVNSNLPIAQDQALIQQLMQLS